MFRIGAGGAIFHFIGRVFIAPDGMGQETGYFAHIEGITGGLFSGPPSEKTAHFTVRSDPFRSQIFQNGDLQATLTGVVNLKLYFNTEPQADFNNPDTFSRGRLIATFKRVNAMLATVGPITTEVFAAEIVSTASFTFKGATYDLKQFVPHGFTGFGSASNNPIQGVPGFVAVLPFVGSTLAVGA